jgi:UDP-glucose 4-epimerase
MSRPWLVTGGAGFVGSHFVARLLERGAASVRVIDDLSTGSRAVLSAWIERGQVELVVANVADRDALTSAAQGTAGIAHFAASVGVERVVDAPSATLRNNLASTLSVVDVASALDAPLLFISTSEVYGKSTAVPFREDADLALGATTCGRWSYAAGKATGEWLALGGGGRAVVARLFNTVGPGQSGEGGMVLPRFVEAAVAGAALRVFGDGAQTRCFANVRDVSAGLADLAAALVVGRLGDARVFNVGSQEEITIRALAERVIAVAGGGSIVNVPYAEAYGAGFEDMRRRVPDLAAIERAIGWVPTTKLDATIAELVAAERERLA